MRGILNLSYVQDLSACGVRNDKKIGGCYKMRMSDYYVYMLTNWTGEVLYTGVTNNLERRLEEHRSKRAPGFTSRYNLVKLVYFEQTEDVHSAITREKQIKSWRREKKNALVETMNPEWNDLAEGWFEDTGCPGALGRPSP